MSKTISERVTILETKFDEFKEQNSKEHAEILDRINHLEHKLDIDNVIKRLDDRYAKKQTEIITKNLDVEINKIENRSKRAFWTSLTALVSFISALILMLIRKVI